MDVEDDNIDPGDAGEGGGPEGGATGGDQGKSDPPGGLLSDAAKGKAGDQGDGGKKGDGDADPDAWKSDLPDGVPDHMIGQNAKETMEKVLKAYKGLRDKGGKDGEKLPEKLDDYKFDLKEKNIELNTDDEASQKIIGITKELALENGMSQKQYDGFMTGVISKMMDAGIVEMPYDAGIEYDKLGGAEKGAERVSAILDWGNNLVNNKVIDQEDLDEFYIMGGTARGVEVLEKLRKMSSEPEIKPDPDKLGEEKAAVLAMMEDERYQNPNHKEHEAWVKQFRTKMKAFR